MSGQLELVPVTRPNGKVYRPRKAPVAVGAEDVDDGRTEIYVLRTHDIDTALPLAQAEARRLDVGSVDPDSAERWWLRGTIRNGERCYDPDAERGCPAVFFEVH